MIGLVTILGGQNDDFVRLLELEIAALGARAHVAAALADCPPSACLLLDLDRFGAVGDEIAPRRIGYTAKGRTAPFTVLHRPFRMAELRTLLLAEEGDAHLRPSADFRTVAVGGETVRLSDREAALLRVLYLADGAPVEKAALAAAVFPDASDPANAVTVYIHYLRKKLERSGKRVIAAHRGSYTLLGD